MGIINLWFKRRKKKHVYIRMQTIVLLYKSKKDGNEQESIQPSTNPDPGYHMGK